jgi:hypothetical protein
LITESLHVVFDLFKDREHGVERLLHISEEPGNLQKALSVTLTSTRGGEGLKQSLMRVATSRSFWCRSSILRPTSMAADGASSSSAGGTA